MLNAVRRHGVFQVARASLRASVSHPSAHLLGSRTAPRGAAPAVTVRPLHLWPTPSRLNAQSTGEEHAEARPSTFAELEERGLINGKIIDNIVGRMRISTMTPVQEMTIPEIMAGSDVYGIMPPPSPKRKG